MNYSQKDLTGKIIKGIGGFYYVDVGEAVCECKARGIFRKEHLIPLVGDCVTITVKENSENTIDSILPRKNRLIRPPLANIDALGIVVSTCSPVPNFLVIDKLISIAESKNIEPVIIITKSDLTDGEIIKNVYLNSGFKVFEGEDIDLIEQFLCDKVTAFTGNSGVGKSTLLNRIDGKLDLSTGEISEKLGRGRHTTRHAELFKIKSGYVADTPGFSSLDLERCEHVSKDELAYCFREFRPFLEKCRFTTCSHINDLGCAVTEALKNGKIEKTRYNSYTSLYNDIKKIKDWKK